MNDASIIQGCREHKAKYQRMLLDRYSPLLMGVAMRYLHDHALAEDALQEMWIKVFNNIDRYDDQGKLIGWLKRILINTILQEKRKKSCLNGAGDLSDYMATEPPRAESDLHAEDIMKMIHTVPSPAKEVFLMNVIDGMNHREIAEVMEIAESTSRVHLTNARKYLRRLFDNTKEVTI